MLMLEEKMVKTKRKWTEADRQFLRENYQNMTDRELAEHFDTSDFAVQYQRVKLGLKHHCRVWTTEKDHFLRNNYMKMTNEELSIELKVSVYSVGSRLSVLGLRRFKEWIPEREQFLWDNYEVMSDAFLAKKLGITEMAVVKHRSRLGLARKIKRRWNKKKEDFLKASYKRWSVSELAAECGMPPGYIENKIVELGLREAEDKPFSKDTSREMIDKEVAGDLSDTDSTLGYRFRKPGAKGKRPPRVWTEDRDSFLRNNYVEMTNKELADELGTTHGAIVKRLGRLGLRRLRNYVSLSEQEQFLRDNYDAMSNAFLAKKLGIAESTVARKLNRFTTLFFGAC